MTGSGGAWVGLSDVLQEGTFSWRDDSDLTYTNWKSNNPNNANDEQHCVWVRRNRIKYPIFASFYDKSLLSFKLGFIKTQQFRKDYTRLGT